MRAFLALCFCVFLGGCGTPIDSVAQMGLSGVSFFFSGKTTTDHGLSLVLQEDCEILRFMDGPICRSIDEYELADREAVLQPLPQTAEIPTEGYLTAAGPDQAVQLIAVKPGGNGVWRDRSYFLESDAVMLAAAPVNNPGDREKETDPMVGRAAAPSQITVLTPISRVR